MKRIYCISFLFSILLNHPLCSVSNLQFDTYTWTQYSGNDDSTINPGEGIYINAKINNIGTKHITGTSSCRN